MAMAASYAASVTASYAGPAILIRIATALKQEAPTGSDAKMRIQ
jgi:hypothetical protein